MRFAYLVLKFVLKYAMWVYYPRIRLVNAPKKQFARTIYACNHAASFMDPLVVASNQRPIVFFMTRSDVFTPWLKPILWMAHMFPIYRMQDGEDTKKKNEAVFKKCNQVLKYGRSLLIFSEGFTDDVFVRRLKPIKKGAVRIGFGALEEVNWKKDIYLQAVGVNYSDPNTLGSDVVVSNSKPIRLNDYKEAYRENPNKVIADLTTTLEKLMQEQLTHVADKKWTDFHEQVMRLTKKGMNAVDYDKETKLLDRWNYSRKLAKWVNLPQNVENENLIGLRAKLADYFKRLDTSFYDEIHLTQLAGKTYNKTKHVIHFVFLFPVFIIGLIHNYPTYWFVKRFVEKTFKRKVFWGSVKMLMGTLINGLYTILVVILLNMFLFQNTAFAWGYFFVVPTLSGVIAYYYAKKLKNYRIIERLRNENLEAIQEERNHLQEEIKRLIPVA